MAGWLADWLDGRTDESVYLSIYLYEYKQRIKYIGRTDESVYLSIYLHKYEQRIKHTHIYIYIYMSLCEHACVHVCSYVHTHACMYSSHCSIVFKMRRFQGQTNARPGMFQAANTTSSRIDVYARAFIVCFREIQEQPA